MAPYVDVLDAILSQGASCTDRTGVGTFSLPGAQMQFDMREGFPLLTLRPIPYKSVFAELVGFLRGYTDAEQFRALGTKIWDANANDNKEWLANPFRMGTDDMGYVYGSQWRNWEASTYAWTLRQADWLMKRGWDSGKEAADRGTYSKSIDQLAECLDLLRTNPSSRRILFHAWNPAELHAMCLPPCHLLYQFHVHGERISLSVYIRSNDMGLGAPFNIASAAALLQVFADASGLTPWKLTISIGDAHVYMNHFEAVKEMMDRHKYESAPELPRMHIEWGTDPQYLNMDQIAATLKPESFVVRDYFPMSPVAAMKMAV